MRAKKPNFFVLGIATVMFICLLASAELLFAAMARYGQALEPRHLQAGYVASYRGMVLLLWLAAAAMMAAIIRQGVPVVPLVWVVQLLRLGSDGTWSMFAERLLFASPLLNYLVLLVGPPATAVLFWWSLAQLNPQGRGGTMVVPGLWLLLVTVSAAGNLFVWYWDQSLLPGIWPQPLGFLMMLAGLVLVAAGAKQPLSSLAIYWGGLIIPFLVSVAIWDWYDGLVFWLLSLLSWSGGFGAVWLEMWLVFSLPIVVAVTVNQLLAWRKGGKIIEIW